MLDIVNAFNILPWDRIAGTLEYHQVFIYLTSIVLDYFWERTLEYGNQDRFRRKGTSCEVLQGSVLRLLLCIAYDSTLHVDDITCGLRGIEGIGLRVVPHKSECTTTPSSSPDKSELFLLT